MLDRRLYLTLEHFKENRALQYWLLAAIMLLAAVLRLYKLGQWSFWIDEIHTVNHAIHHFSTPDLILENIPPLRNWIPVSVILTAQVINLVGVNELNARLAAAVIGIVTVPVLYFPIRKIFNVRVALIAVLLLAVSPWHIEWSQGARFYTSLMLFYSLALFAFYFGLERDRLSYFFLFIFLVNIATSERLITFFIVPVLACYLVALIILHFDRPPGFRSRKWREIWSSQLESH